MRTAAAASHREVWSAFQHTQWGLCWSDGQLVVTLVTAQPLWWSIRLTFWHISKGAWGREKTWINIQHSSRIQKNMWRGFCYQWCGGRWSLCLTAHARSPRNHHCQQLLRPLETKELKGLLLLLFNRSWSKIQGQHFWKYLPSWRKIHKKIITSITCTQ